MRHLVRSGAAARMLIVATFRDDEADVPAELACALVDVYRTEGVVRLRLAGLSEADVAEFVRLTAGAEPDPDLAAAILGLTDGNAFLVTELWRELLDADDVDIGPGGARLTRPAAELGTPTTVREVVNQRLTRLSAEANEVLALAAVAGADFELDTVQRTEVVPGDGAARRRRRGGAERPARGGAGPASCLSLRPRARPARRDRQTLRGARGGDPPARRRGARGAQAAGRQPRRRWPRWRTTTLRRPRSAGSSGRSTTTCSRPTRRRCARLRRGRGRGSRSRSSSASASRSSGST